MAGKTSGTKMAGRQVVRKWREEARFHLAESHVQVDSTLRSRSPCHPTHLSLCANLGADRSERNEVGQASYSIVILLCLLPVSH